QPAARVLACRSCRVSARKSADARRVELTRPRARRGADARVARVRRRTVALRTRRRRRALHPARIPGRVERDAQRLPGVTLSASANRLVSLDSGGTPTWTKNSVPHVARKAGAGSARKKEFSVI